MDKNQATLHGKVAIVTGAGEGISKAIAIAYANAGASVCCAARTLAQIEETVNAIKQFGGFAAKNLPLKMGQGRGKSLLQK